MVRRKNRELPGKPRKTVTQKRGESLKEKGWVRGSFLIRPTQVKSCLEEHEA